MPAYEGIHIISREGPINLTDIITANIHYSGSTIVFKETATIKLNIDEPGIVDVDFDWFYPRFYLGTYQIANWGGYYSRTPQDEGYFTSETTILTRYHQYTLTASPSKPNVYDDLVSIEQCNLRMTPELIPINGIATLTYVTTSIEPLLLGKTKISPPEVANNSFYQDLGTIAMKLRPGVSFDTTEYLLQVVNTIYNDNPEFEQPNCSLPAADCNAEFAAFVLANNNGQPIDIGSPPLIFSSNELCRFNSFPPGSPAQCINNIFTCTDGGTRDYWTPPQG